MKKLFLTIILSSISLISIQAQEDLLDILDKELPEADNTVTSIFKGTRILNGHSVVNRKKKELEFIISHRFGSINLGLDELFGLDQSNIRFSFEYGLSDDLTIGIGRSSFEKTYDGFLKYSLMKQKTGKKPFPISISLFGSVAYKTIKDYDPEKKPPTTDRLFYTAQVLIARKISPSVSLQISPTYIHRNSVKIEADPHDFFAVGFGGRVKLSKRVSFNSEYYYTFDQLASLETTNSLAFGVDIETGGHVFQLILSNSITMIEKSFITETNGDFFGGDIHFGFNISRTF